MGVKVERARPPPVRLVHGELGRSVAAVHVQKAYTMLREKGVEVVDEVDEDKAPSNVLEKPHRRAR